MKKKLYRSAEDKLIAGVLAGLAEYFEHDVVFWRLGFLVLWVLTGFMPGILLYLAAWVLTPLQPSIEPIPESDYTVYS